MKPALALVGITLSLLSLVGPTAHAPTYTTLLIRLRPTVTATEEHRLFQQVEAAVIGQIPQLDLWCVSVPAAQSGAALAALNRDPAVVYAELDASAWATLLPNDPGWGQQWALQKINAPLAWDITAGRPDVVIAVLDSGVILSHPDLANRLWANPGEVPDNGVDDDGNGKTDDFWGWRFYHNWDGQTLVPREDHRVADDNGHGTHVAGIAGAEINNGLGMAGMAGGSRLMTVKVLDQYGTGWYSDIARGIVYAVDNGAGIINLSVGGEPPSETLQDAVDYAHAHGVLVVAAAGNDGGAVLYPAACEHVLAVAATDQSDAPAGFSNHGPQVDVAAPGVDIYSTWPWRGGYFTKSGTSMAAPHVAGLAALIWSARPDLRSRAGDRDHHRYSSGREWWHLPRLGRVPGLGTDQGRGGAFSDDAGREPAPRRFACTVAGRRNCRHHGNSPLHGRHLGHVHGQWRGRLSPGDRPGRRRGNDHADRWRGGRGGRRYRDDGDADWHPVPACSAGPSGLCHPGPGVVGGSAGLVGGCDCDGRRWPRQPALGWHPYQLDSQRGDGGSG